METKEIASGLVALCREGKFDEAMAAYYSDGIVSDEVHGIEVEGPFVGMGQFVVRFKPVCGALQARCHSKVQWPANHRR